MADIDEQRVYEHLGRIEGRQIEALGILAALNQHVMGTPGNPGLSERLRAIEGGYERDHAATQGLLGELPKVKSELQDLVDFEHREHGALRFLLVGGGLAVGIGGLVVAIVNGAG